MSVHKFNECLAQGFQPSKYIKISKVFMLMTTNVSNENSIPIECIE